MKKGGVVIPNAPKWYQRLAAWIVYLFIRAVAATIRFRVDDRSEFFNGTPPEPAIYCVWHNRLALCLKLYGDWRKKPDPKARLAAMVSARKDGAFLAAS